MCGARKSESPSITANAAETEGHELRWAAISGLPQEAPGARSAADCGYLGRVAQDAENAPCGPLARQRGERDRQGLGTPQKMDFHAKLMVLTAESVSGVRRK